MSSVWNAYLRPSLAMIALFTLLTGIALPLIYTGGAEALVPYQANGSLIMRGGKVIGSALIGQNFTGPQYFHPRPSAITEPDPKDPSKTIPDPYDADNSGASNLGPTSKQLVDTVQDRMKALGLSHAPADMVTSSASGLDPDISVPDAGLQVARVAAARHMADAAVQAIVQRHVTGRTFGIFGEPHVNVLELNLALDAAAKK